MADGAALVNASFESNSATPEGWSESIGAWNGDGADSMVSIDRSVASDGAASLRLWGDASTRRWRTIEQDVDVQGSERVRLRVDARCRGLAQGSALSGGANAVLEFYNDAGERRSLVASAALHGDRNEWTELVVDAIAPPDVKRVRIGLLLSMTGTLWFDDVRLTHGPATADDAAGRTRAFDALAGHLRRTYPFFGMAGRPAADALFGRHRKPCTDAKDAVAFLQAVHAMLAELNDVHVNVETAQRRLATAQPNPSPRNWNSSAIAAALT